jgi:hypothetical protein
MDLNYFHTPFEPTIIMEKIVFITKTFTMNPSVLCLFFVMKINFSDNSRGI